MGYSLLVVVWVEIGPDNISPLDYLQTDKHTYILSYTRLDVYTTGLLVFVGDTPFLAAYSNVHFHIEHHSRKLGFVGTRASQECRQEALFCYLKRIELREGHSQMIHI